MLDAGEEVGEIAHRGWKMQCAVSRPMQESPGRRLDHPSFGAVRGKQRGEPLPQRDARRRAQRHQRVERRTGGGSRRPFRVTREQSRRKRRLQIENLVADRHACARRLSLRTEDAEWQILNRKFRVPVRRSDPTRAVRIVRFVNQATHCLAPWANSYVDERTISRNITQPRACVQRAHRA
jgi:hypothetical protein